MYKVNFKEGDKPTQIIECKDLEEVETVLLMLKESLNYKYLVMDKAGKVITKQSTPDQYL